jgi:Protein of unknown function (DUF3455)
MNISPKVLLNVVTLVFTVLAVKAPAQPMSAIDKDKIIATLHAEGAQIYECKPDTSKPALQAHTLTWQFREPIATLLVGGQSIGRHYAGPNWDYIDGSGVRGRVVASRAGATAGDIPWLDIEVVEHRNEGILSEATSVQRVNTRGGMTQGPCAKDGEYLSVPYAADYLFLHKG